MRLAWAIALAAIVLCPVATQAADNSACPKTRLPPIALPHLRGALRDGKEVRIIAFGSSSTAGARASDEHHTYPALLEADLAHALPGAHVEVVNRGVGGQDAIEMLARIGTDVLTQSPTLVIWQVGANAAMRHTDPAEFRREIDNGVRQMEAVGADVILMDNQRSPAILASPTHTQFDQILADMALRDDAKVFARGRLMELWQQDGHPYSEFLADDGVHHNDLGYSCVAQALAISIVDGLGPSNARLQAAQ